eukprot:COSAG06_NODE_3996_length_4677_cov_1.649410_5_plen_107_part_00
MRRSTRGALDRSMPVTRAARSLASARRHRARQLLRDPLGMVEAAAEQVERGAPRTARMVAGVTARRSSGSCGARSPAVLLVCCTACVATASAGSIGSNNTAREVRT